jgi:hypothetical protein
VSDLEARKLSGKAAAAARGAFRGVADGVRLTFKGRDGIDARDTTDAETDLEARRLTGNQIGGLAIAGGSVLAFGAGVGKGVYDRVHHKNRRSLEEDDEQLARDTAQDQIDVRCIALQDVDEGRRGSRESVAAQRSLD